MHCAIIVTHIPESPISNGARSHPMKKYIVLIATVIEAVTATPALANADLAKQRGCLSCHAVDRKLVGPSFQAVAQKYAGSPAMEEILAGRVKGGTKGAWGPVPMPPNSQVPISDIKSIVTWILAGAPVTATATTESHTETLVVQNPTPKPAQDCQKEIEALCRFSSFERTGSPYDRKYVDCMDLYKQLDSKPLYPEVSDAVGKLRKLEEHQRFQEEYWGRRIREASRPGYGNRELLQLEGAANLCSIRHHIVAAQYAADNEIARQKSQTSLKEKTSLPSSAQPNEVTKAEKQEWHANMRENGWSPVSRQDKASNSAPLIDGKCVKHTQYGSGVSDNVKRVFNGCGRPVQVLGCYYKPGNAAGCRNGNQGWGVSSTIPPNGSTIGVSHFDGPWRVVFYVCDMSDTSKLCVLPKQIHVPEGN